MPEAYYTGVYCTDVGIRKRTNEDSALMMQAETAKGPVLLAAVCDGMGGLSEGELASAVMTRALRDWFAQQLPQLLMNDDFEEQLTVSWNSLIQRMNRRINRYGMKKHINLGTTVTALLTVEDNYYLVNVGDSRVYLLADQLYQLTHDQTLVQREIDQGKITPEQGAVDPRRSVLLQCVGASQTVVPDFFGGQFSPRHRFLLCCDGFRHVITPQEIFDRLGYVGSPTKEQMQQALNGLVQLNKERMENDNITALLVQV